MLADDGERFVVSRPCGPGGLGGCAFVMVSSFYWCGKKTKR